MASVLCLIRRSVRDKIINGLRAVPGWHVAFVIFVSHKNCPRRIKFLRNNAFVIVQSCKKMLEYFTLLII